MKKTLYYICFILILTGCTPSMDKSEVKKVMNFGVEVKVDRSGELFTVSPAKILQVLGFRGNIPAINNPRFLPAKEADIFLKNDDMVVGLNYKGIVKAYPVKVMRWHIVVNDHAGDEPLLISYDPISDMGLAYKRVVLDKELMFKTSDRVYNSNPILQDSATKTKWSQFLGEAIMGRLAGQKMESVPLVMTTWAGWKDAYPETVVLSKETGVNRDYERNVYENYYRKDHLLYDVENEDKRLPNKTPVYGLEVEGSFKAYPAATLTEGTTLEDNVSGVPVKLTANSSGIVAAVRNDRDEELAVRRLLWFSWAAFHPETELYRQGS